MANYTFPILLTLGYGFNYLLLYRKNQIIHSLIFIGISFASMYTAYTYDGYYMGMSIMLMIIGFSAFTYSWLGYIKDTTSSYQR